MKGWFKMLSELQGANRPSTPQTAATPVVAAPAVDQVAKVQAPKPNDIKVDMQALRASLQDSIEKLNKAMRDGGRNLNFHMDEQVGGPVVLVKNADTGEVVRQIPNEVVVRIAHNIESFKGVLHNKFI
jgi:flagellar protein FlaG